VSARAAVGDVLRRSAIYLASSTFVPASVERVFKISLDIGTHLDSMSFHGIAPTRSWTSRRRAVPTIHHRHQFSSEGSVSRMVDEIYDAPFGLIGDGVERIILTRYLRKLIVVRNEFIVETARREA